MNIKVNGHNLVVVTLMAVLGILALKVAAKSRAGSLPVVGQALNVAASI